METKREYSWDSSSLSTKEKEVFDLLLQVAEEDYQRKIKKWNERGDNQSERSNQSLPTKTVLRAAGGWVRDKLLGVESHDIDIALDNCQGQDFGRAIIEYQTSRNPSKEPTKMGVVKSNPDQSKHLETATMKVLDMDIDFCNLRVETYADSRIPTTGFGSPKEDAFRRDLTINSLFYNLNEDILEDFTGKGVQDLKNKLIRTPLSPHQTFLDDPLRVLRAVRFASRFSYHLDTDLCAAALLPQVKTALSQKVSKERIGKELMGMFHHPRVTKESMKSPVYAFKLLRELELLEIIFPLPQGVELKDERLFDVSMERMAQVKRVLSLPWTEEKEDFVFTKEEMTWIFMGAFFSNWTEYFYLKKGKQESVIKYQILESLKLSVKDAESINSIANSCTILLNFINSKEKISECDRKELGLLIRQMGKLWKCGFYAALAIALPPIQKELLNEPLPAEETMQMQKLKEWFVRVCELDLKLSNDLTPLLNGTEAAAVLNKSSGTWLTAVQARQIEWRLTDPNLDVEKCHQLLKLLIEKEPEIFTPPPDRNPKKSKK
eukprot:TRINITY_DN6822_c0_g2_i1.p1 TRINITY_DN6822_c0_g2~~TRINITY_DN6822_c0_g2_i1.p1  ORF type:complete len:549 (-),score=186.67 TRINITY_DN6822_c0_g2_i1:7-1653(-)